MRFKNIGAQFNRNMRNDLNNNFTTADTELTKQKKRVDDLIINNPSPNEVQDARMGFPVLRDKLEATDEQLAHTTTRQDNTIRYVDIRETNAVPNDPNFDNSAIIKELLENNNYVRIDGEYYTNEITIDRTGKPTLVLETNMTLRPKDGGLKHILRIGGGRVRHTGVITFLGDRKVLDNFYIDFGTSHSQFDFIFSDRALWRGIYVEYVTDVRIKKSQVSWCGQRLITTYANVGETSDRTIIEVSGIFTESLHINGVHFIIIGGTLYRVMDCYLNNGKQTLEIFPKNNNLTTGEGKVLVGTGMWSECTKLLLDDYDVRTCGVGILQNSQFGMTINHSIIQGCPVGFSFNKEGIGTKNSEDNLINAPWLETDTEFPIVTSVTSRSGITIIEPWTTIGDFKFITQFGQFAPVTTIKNGRVYENNKIRKLVNNAGTSRDVPVGGSIFWRSTSGTSQQTISISANNTKKFVNSSQETTIYVNHTNLRPIRLTCETGYTIDGGIEKIIDDLRKGVIRVILDESELNYITFIQKEG